MQKMQIEISYQDQLELEKICTDKGWTYSEFFKQLLNGYIKFGLPVYKKENEDVVKPTAVPSLPDSLEDQVVEDETVVEDKKDIEEKPKRRGRPPKAK